MGTGSGYHDASTIANAEACLADMNKLLLACQDDFRRRPHQYMALPQAIKKLQRAMGHPDPDIIQENIERWRVLKRCKALVTMDQTFPSALQSEHKEAAKKEVQSLAGSTVYSHRKDQTWRDTRQRAIYQVLRKNARAMVDVVDDGYEWLLVRLLQPKRLAMQMTESGWAWGCYEKGDTVPAEEREDVSLTKRLKLLVAAAKMNPHEYCVPRIRLVLPLIGRDNADFDIFFDQLSAMDSDVKIIIEDKNSPFLTVSPPVDFVSNLMGDPLANLTSTIILEHTTLVDMISDLTHCRLEPQPWQVPSTRAQIEEENSYEGGWMAKWLYPVLSGRKLVVTQATVEHLYGVLETVGTATERERARLFVPKPGREPKIPDEEARSRFQALSVHALPDDVQIPVEVDIKPWTSLDVIAEEVEAGRIHADAARWSSSELFPAYRLSTILRGWALQHTTVTSNKDIKGQVRKALPKAIRGPTIYTLQVARLMLSSHATPRPA
jgi:hypothetical protein